MLYEVITLVNWFRKPFEFSNKKNLKSNFCLVPDVIKSSNIFDQWNFFVKFLEPTTLKVLGIYLLVL